MKSESFFDIMCEARDMLRGRSEPEQYLIYTLCKLDKESQTAIILAYEGMYKDE